MLRIILSSLSIVTLGFVVNAHAGSAVIHQCINSQKQMRLYMAKDPQTGHLVLQAGFGPIVDQVSNHMMALPKQRLIIGVVNQKSNNEGLGFKVGNKITLDVTRAPSGPATLTIHDRDNASGLPILVWRDLKCETINVFM